MRRSLTALVLGLSLLCCSQTQAAAPAKTSVKSAAKTPPVTLTLFSADAITAAVQSLVTEYETVSGTKLAVVQFSEASRQSTGAELAAAQAADVVLSARSTMDTLVAQGRVDSASRIDFGKSFIAVAVRAGSARPDIGSQAAFRETLVSAPSVAYSNNASGMYLTHWLFPHMQLPEDFKNRLVEGNSAGETVARGEAQIGLQQMSELKSVSGIEVVGLIPDALQQMKLYSAGIVKGSPHPAEAAALLAWLRSGASSKAVERGGLMPLR